MTKDGVLSRATRTKSAARPDAALKFPARKTTKQIDGTAVIEDFTLPEIQTLGQGASGVSVARG